MTSRLLELVLERDEIADLDPASRRLALREIVMEALPGEESAVLVAEAADLVDGYGRLGPLMRDPRVTDVLVNGPSEVWVERDGRLELDGLRFEDEKELNALVQRLVSIGGGRIDSTRPIADARLPDGGRLHAVLPPLAPRGPLVSIRRFPSAPYRLDDLTGRGMLTEQQSRTLSGWVRARKTIAIGGATGTGKTTLMGALLSEVPDDERVVVIEETPELQFGCTHAVSLVARAPNVEGKGAIGLDDLVRAALRMRPDRIVVGEVRGPEALVALDAMSTGHEGSLVTVHARSAGEIVDRMVALALQPGSPDPSTLAERFARSIDAVVHLERTQGRRRVSSIIELR